MSSTAVEVSVHPVLSNRDPLSFEIRHRANALRGAPMPKAEAVQMLRDAHTGMSERLQRLHPLPFQPMKAELVGNELLHLQVGWYFGAFRPTHPFCLGDEVVGDFGYLSKRRVKPLSRFPERLPRPPVLVQTAREKARLDNGYELTARLVIEEEPKTVTVHPRFANEDATVIVALGWQIGLWFGNRTLLIPSGGNNRLRIADVGGIIGGELEVKTQGNSP